MIFGSHISALGVLRLLAERGIRCYVADATSNIIVRSRWYRSPGRTLAETSDGDDVAGFLQSLNIPDAVLIACSDTWTLAVAGLRPETRERFRSSLAPREAVEQFIDKDRFRALVDRLGIPHPRTVPLRGPADLDLVTDYDLAHGFLKPTDSQLHNRLFGAKGAFVDSRATATRVVEQASAAGVRLMLQEFIPGGSSKTIVLDGFVDRHGTVIAMMARRRVRMKPPSLSNTASDVTIPLADVSRAVDAVHKVLVAVDYRGIFSVEFKFDVRDGLFKIIELNARPFWQVAHSGRAGLDLPWMSYLDAQDFPVPKPAPYRIGQYGLYEVADAEAIFHAWRSIRRPEGPVITPWLRGDRALFWWSDPLPAIFDLSRMARRFITRGLGRLRRSPRVPQAWIAAFIPLGDCGPW